MSTFMLSYIESKSREPQHVWRSTYVVSVLTELVQSAFGQVLIYLRRALSIWAIHNS